MPTEPTMPDRYDLPTSWSDMSPEKRVVMQEFLVTHPDARRLHQAAGGDHDFTLWLLSVFVHHWTIATGPLEDADNPALRTRYDSRWTPQEAVAAATAPSALVDGHLICPHSDARDVIVEEDRAIRIHRLIADPPEVITEVIADSGFRHLRFYCGHCDGTVSLPDRVVRYS